MGSISFRTTTSQDTTLPADVDSDPNTPTSAIPAPTTMQIPCIVVGVGTVLLISTVANVNAERFRELVWTEMLKIVSGMAPVDVVDEFNTAGLEVYDDDAETRCYPARLFADFTLWKSLVEWWNGFEIGCCRSFCGQKPQVCSIYLAKGSPWLCMDKWMAMDDSLLHELKRGKVPWRIRWLFLTHSAMPSTGLVSDMFPATHAPGAIFALVTNVPEILRDGLLSYSAADRRLYEMLHAQDLASRFSLLGWVFAALTMVFGVYFYATEKNIARGFGDDATMERLVFWSFPVLGAVMVKVKDYYILKSNNLQRNIDYAEDTSTQQSSEA